jgi:pimeloyl-ACP methyl ester carboxylesterase
MSRWARLSRVGGLAVGVAAAGAGAVVAAEKIAVGRIRLRPDPAADEPLGQLRGQPATVLAHDGTPLYVEISGPDDAPVTIIFSHGYTLSQDVWHYQRQALEGRARLVFWDQRGHGRTGTAAGPEHVPVSIDQLGADLSAVLAATAPADGPVLLVGHSMGGMTIMALAARQPELFGPRVVGTVLISTAASGLDPAGWLPAPLRSLLRQAAPTLLRRVSHGRPAELIERTREAAGDVAFLGTRYMAFGDPGMSPTIVDFLERIIRATPVQVVADFYVAILEHDQRAALDILGRAPAVVLAGDRDRLVSLRLAGEVAAGIPDAEYILVPGGGHQLILEHPDIVNDAIGAMLDGALADAQARTA